MGYAKPLKHLAYEFVTLPEGAMASRKGNVILLKDLLAATRQSAREEVMKRHGDWNEGKVELTAWGVSLALVTTTLRLGRDVENDDSPRVLATHTDAPSLATAGSKAGLSLLGSE